MGREIFSRSVGEEQVGQAKWLRATITCKQSTGSLLQVGHADFDADLLLSGGALAHWGFPHPAP